MFFPVLHSRHIVRCQVAADTAFPLPALMAQHPLPVIIDDAVSAIPARGADRWGWGGEGFPGELPFVVGRANPPGDSGIVASGDTAGFPASHW